MESRFRADDDGASTYFSPALSDAEQALRAGYISNDIGRNDFVRNPVDVREEILWELEKQRIREEVIAAEVVRKRALEAEVRMELLLERELALQRIIEGFSLRSDPRVPFMNRPDGSRTRLEERLSFPNRPEVGISEMLRFENLAEARVPEVKPLPVVSKGPVMFLPKPMNPNPNLAGTKRKAATRAAAGGSEIPISGSKKEPQKEWSCALCRVSITSEQGLNEHLKGEKHQAKEAELRANRRLHVSKRQKIQDLKRKIGEPVHKKIQDLKRENGEPVHKNIQDLKRENGEPVHKKMKKYKFWCNLCLVGARTEDSIAAHQRGKKHMALVMELVQNGGVVPAIVALPEASPQKAKDTNVLANEEKKESVRGKWMQEASWQKHREQRNQTSIQQQ